MAAYNNFYKSVDVKANACFVGANTPHGFVSDWKELFSEDTISKLYIIKGGPGTGKSTMMKKCAAAAEKAGAAVTFLYCSSDPDSLDGIICEKNGKKIVLADGTAPHQLDPKYAGACGEIINCGSCWHAATLAEKKEQIVKLSTSKELAYTMAYKYLAGAAEILSSLQAIISKASDREKMLRCIKRTVLALPRQKASCTVKKARTFAISMKGAVHLSTFEGAKNLIAIEDCSFFGAEFFRDLADELTLAGYSVVISISPLGDIAEILLPDIDFAFIPYKEELDYLKIIRLRRFIDKAYLSENISKRKFGSRCLMSLLEGATASLEEAFTYHDALETIYVKEMNFSALNALTATLSKAVISQLG